MHIFERNNSIIFPRIYPLDAPRSLAFRKHLARRPIVYTGICSHTRHIIAAVLEITSNCQSILHVRSSILPRKEEVIRLDCVEVFSFSPLEFWSSHEFAYIDIY